VGSSDGWVYCLAADSGQQRWRYRAAPIDRKIPVYGHLSSTWPVSSGVLVQDGVAFAAAGIASHDGTHVYALDAATGRLIWHNGTSGNLNGDGSVVGVSVQGHLLFHENRLYLAGGNVVSPAIYDADSGPCLNTLDQQPTATLDDHWQQQRSPRGSELVLAGNRVLASGPMMYAPTIDGPASRYHGEEITQARNENVTVRATPGQILRLAAGTGAAADRVSLWEYDGFLRTDALALAGESVVVAGLLRASSEDAAPAPTLAILDVTDGRLVWSSPLSARAITSGIAVDRSGRILVSSVSGTVQCWAAQPGP
jgi:outer membrane protein assembly factor BamB